MPLPPVDTPTGGVTVKTAALKDHAWWENYFRVGGDWEQNGGRRQTRIFAECFVHHAGLSPDVTFSLLDVGCALGDALAVFARAYPQARLHGLDFSATAIARCREQFGSRFGLRCGDLDAVSGHHDVIYCSNTLEHFADFESRAGQLLAHCTRLFVMVPFRETDQGRALVPDPASHHQHTFQRDSFDGLLHSGAAQHISQQVFSSPGAWGWSRTESVVQFGKNLLRVAIGRHWLRAPLQILYGIEARRPDPPDAG